MLISSIYKNMKIVKSGHHTNSTAIVGYISNKDVYLINLKNANELMNIEIIQDL
jgi:hypothetical protein